MGLYKPSTYVSNIVIPWLSIVQRADPDWARDKFRQVEYRLTNRVFWANPYTRGSFNTAKKLTSVAYSGPATFAAGDLTNVGADFVTLKSTSATPGTLTTRTAAQMLADIPNGMAPLDYALRIANTGGGGDLTVAPGSGIQVVGRVPIVIKDQTFWDLVVRFLDSATAQFLVMGVDNPYNSVTH